MSLTDEEKTEIVGKMVAALNGVFETDPNALYALQSLQVPCNQLLEFDPYLEVDESPLPANGYFTVSMMDVINGMLKAAGLPLIDTVWARPEGTWPRFSGFGIASEETREKRRL